MDPSDMTDEELRKASGAEEQPEETVKDEATADPPAKEPEKEPEAKEDASQEEEPSESEPEEKSEKEEDTQDEQEEEKPVSRREQMRVADLLKKYGPPQEPKKSESKAPDFRDVVSADDDTYSLLEESAKRYGDQREEEGLERTKTLLFRTRLEIDAPKVEAKYPKLDKNSDQFDPEVANDINTMYLSLVGFNPENGRVANENLRYADFVEAQMSLTERLADEKTAESSKNIAKQAAKTGIRPDGSAPKGMDLGKQPWDMTDEELKAAISATIPRRRS